MRYLCAGSSPAPPQPGRSHPDDVTTSGGLVTDGGGGCSTAAGRAQEGINHSRRLGRLHTMCTNLGDNRDAFCFVFETG